MKFISVEPVTLLVQHVDFGSDDTLPTSKYESYHPTSTLPLKTMSLCTNILQTKCWKTLWALNLWLVVEKRCGEEVRGIYLLVTMLTQNHWVKLGFQYYIGGSLTG